MIVVEVQEDKLSALVPTSSYLRNPPIEGENVRPRARTLMKANMRKEIQVTLQASSIHYPDQIVIERFTLSPLNCRKVRMLEFDDQSCVRFDVGHMARAVY